MGSVSIVSILALAVMALATQASKVYPNGIQHYDLNDAPALFEKFIKDYDRHYKDDADKEAHYQAFVKELGRMNRLNSLMPPGIAWDIQEYTDFTKEDWHKKTEEDQQKFKEEYIDKGWVAVKKQPLKPYRGY